MIKPISPKVYLSGNTLWNLSKKFVSGLHIFVVEAFATLWHVVPASIKWFYRRNFSQDITCFSLKIVANKTTHYAYLYLHGQVPVQGKNVSPVLIVHGDWGHPFSTLHLANIAESKTKEPTFSLYIPKAHDNSLLEESGLLLGEALDAIEGYVKRNGGILKGILGAGHSKGTILLAKKLFVDQDVRLKALFAVGGRLNVPEHDQTCSKQLEPLVKNIFTFIKKDTKKPLYQIIPENDWNSTREAMAVRPGSHCHIVPGMHLSGLYQAKTSRKFEKFLQKCV